MNARRMDAFMTILRRQTPLGNGLRWGITLVAVATGWGLRWALTAWVGPGLPTYITFYPMIMVAALLAGWRPGMLATCITGLGVAYHLLPPLGQFGIATPVDQLGLVIFLGMGSFMSAFAELYRRNRDKVAAYEREATLSENREILRRQVELVDPVRAEVIAREMQRVVLERGGTPAASLKPAGLPMRRVADVAGAVVAVMGVLVLAGWMSGLDVLKRVMCELPSMKPNTALCFLLAGAALALRDRCAVRRACAGLVCALAALTLAESITGWNFGFDELLFRDLPDYHTTHPGRMAEATALALLLGGGSLLLMQARGRALLWAQQALALGTVIIGMVPLLGFCYHVELFYRLAGTASMALHTALGLIVLAVGALVARADGVVSVFASPGPGAQLTRRLLAAVVVLPVVLGWFIGFGLRMGWYDEGMDIALVTLAMVLTLVGLVGWTAYSLNRSDAARSEIEIQLRQLVELMDHAHEPLIVREPGGVIRAWNRGAERLYGWSAAEALGQRKQSLLHTTGHRIEELDGMLENAGHWEGELVQTTRDGRRVVVASYQTASRTSGGQILILESNSDITQRKQAEEIQSAARAAALNLMQDAVTARRQAEQAQAALSESEARFRSTFHNAATPMAVKLSNGRILEVNQAYCDMLGYTEQEMLVTTLEGLTYPEDRDTVGREALRQLTAREVISFQSEIRYLHKLGHPVWCDTSASLVCNPDGSVAYLIVQAHDITARKTAEDEIRLLNHQMESRVLERTTELRETVTALEAEIQNRQRLEREILEVSEREQSRLGQDLHDALGQELSGIAMLGDVLAKQLQMQSHPSSQAAAQIASYVRVAIDSTRRLAKGYYPIELDRYGLLMALKDLAQQTSHRTGICCELRQHGAEPDLDKFTEIHIYRIVQECISNAVKHAEPSHISVESRAAEGVHSFIITNDGVGFEKPAGSPGMGLHLMEYRARVIHAQITLERPAAGGCRVTCRLKR